MRVNFKIRAKPFSINQMYYKSRAVKTKEAREWEQSIFRQLKSQEVQEKLGIIRDFFDPIKHTFICRLTAIYPPELFFNQQGSISAKTFDITNFEKSIIDLLFLSKYHDSPSSAFTKNLNTDDRYISSLLSKKKPSKDDAHWIQIQIAVVDLKNILVHQDEH